MELTRREVLRDSAIGAAAVSLAGIGTAAADEAPKASWELPQEPITDIAETYEADVIVVGCGVSGMVTANSAQEQGLKVIIVTASSKPISRGGSNNAVYSKAMEKLGIPRWDVAKELRREQALNGCLPDQRKFAKFAKCSENAMNWMIDIMESHGFETSIEPNTPYPEDDVYYSPQASHAWINEENTAVGQTQSFVANTLAQKFQDEGGTIVFNTVAKQLVREEDGRVDAVICQREDGKYVKYVGPKAIVLATGDFSANRELMQKYCPRMLPFLNSAYLDGEPDYEREFAFGGLYKGDGQKMGLQIGAAWQHDINCAPMVIGAGDGTRRVYCTHWGLKVNTRGERYCNEDMPEGFASGPLYQQPGSMAYSIWDDAYADGDSWMAMHAPYGTAPMTTEQIKATWPKGYDTLEEAIESLGLPLEKTLATIERYNELCDAGYDEDFLKDPAKMKPIRTPPFYTGTETMMFLTVCGGLRTDDQMRVCDENDNPIPGLYNVGIMVGDMYGNMYTFLIFGFNYGACCLTFGYETGKFIAANEPIEYEAFEDAGVKALYEPGVYSATVQGYGGDVTVTMTLSENHISDITIEGPGEEQGVQAMNEMSTMFILSNSALVDGVAGATITSDAVREAALQCIEQAKK